MKDEIKEFNEEKYVEMLEDGALYDYITNLQEKLNKIDKLINTDYGWVSYYYKYNNRYLKSEIKEDINNILQGGDEE